MKSGAFVGCRISPDFTAMTLHDAHGDGETGSCSFELFLAMQASENLEDFFLVAHFETNSVVAHSESALINTEDFDFGLLAGRLELDRVREQVLDGLTNEQF